MVKSLLSKLVILILGLSTSTSHAQNSEALDFILSHNPLESSQKSEDLSFTFHGRNEVSFLFMGMIRVYQNFVSSQQNDTTTCIFTPSCSRFGYESIKRNGPILGILMTSDRLQRCHNYGKGYYPIHAETLKCFDPVDLYSGYCNND